MESFLLWGIVKDAVGTENLCDPAESAIVLKSLPQSTSVYMELAFSPSFRLALPIGP